ncbi:hypothetical protein BDQ17DRAFT_1364195 [Cyathus striatus]|nr:hypothetical protein BDQ17DRAFT_1364195 [Cyathus striatus]
MLPPLDLPLYSFDMCNQRRTGNSLPSEPRATFAPLPPLGGYSVAIHPLIAYGSRWLIEHDVTQPPFSGLLISPSYSTSSQCLSENATIPGLTCLTIYFQPIDKYLVVHSADRPAVTIYDVLHSVYEAAHAAVLQRTDHHLLSPQIDGWHQGVSAQGLEARRFSKAVFQSLFNGRQRWGGLTASKSHADIWILHTK